MNVIQKSEAIKAGLRKGFQNGSSKMARRKCYGYAVGPDGELMVNFNEAQVVRWIFERYLAGDSLGKIAAGLEKQGILSPTGKPKWNREAIDKLLSNEKYTGRVILQKTISTGAVQADDYFSNGAFEIARYGANTLMKSNRAPKQQEALMEYLREEYPAKYESISQQIRALKEKVTQCDPYSLLMYLRQKALIFLIKSKGIFDYLFISS